MEYNKEESDLIRTTLSNFMDSEIEFVILRGFKNLPHSVPGGDVDLIVSPEDFTKAIEITEQNGFELKEPNLDSIIYNFSKHPFEFIKKYYSDLEKIIETILGLISYSYIKNSYNIDDKEKYLDYQTYNGKVKIHMVNHLAYESPMNKKMIRVDPRVEESFFSNHRIYEGLPVPSAPDELSHLICRGVFKYEGSFPEHYKKRCDELANHVFSSENQTEHFKDLLSLIFFDADCVVFKNVKNNTYDKIKKDLLRYSDY